MEGTLSEIRFFAPDFAPKGWALCQGQLLAINTNQALFSLLGTVYGGNGTTTFGLPDFRSRMPVGAGQGPGLPYVQLGQMNGVENVTMNIQQMPMHNHPGSCTVTIPAYSETGNRPDPTNSYLAGLAGLYAAPAVTDTTLASMGVQPAIAPAGANQPMSILQPYLAINTIICTQGLFPSRN